MDEKLKDILRETQKISNNAQEDVYRLRNRVGTQLSINGGGTFFIFYFFATDYPIIFFFTIIPMMISNIYCLMILLPKRVHRIEFEIIGNLKKTNMDNFYEKTLIPYYNKINHDNREINDTLSPYLVKIYYWFASSFFMGSYLILIQKFVLILN